MAGVMDSVDQRTQLAGHNRLELLTFRLNGKQRYGINVFKIQEVVQCPPLTQIPHAHPVVRGVATMRGKTIPVIDLSMAIGDSRTENLGSCFMIVAEYNRSIQGFLVGGVERIVNLQWSDILAPPKGSGGDSYMTAVTRMEGKLVEIIDVEKVLSEVNNVSTEVSEEITKSMEGEALGPVYALVADDSMVARNQVVNTLAQVGVESIVAKNGREALAMLRQMVEEADPRLSKMALVVSDIEMPEMDGYTLTTEIRKDPDLAELYILLHTSLSGGFNAAMVEKVGANRFVSKFNADDLAKYTLLRIKEFSDKEKLRSKLN